MSVITTGRTRFSAPCMIASRRGKPWARSVLKYDTSNRPSMIATPNSDTKPTAAEVKKCKTFLEKTDNRSDAFEDILWALINSTEFQTRL